MALTDEQLDIISEALKPLYQNLEAEVISDIAFRISQNLMIPLTAQNEMEALRRSGFSPKAILKKVYDKLKASNEYKKTVAENNAEYKKELQRMLDKIQKDAVGIGKGVIRDAAKSMASGTDVWEKVEESLKDGNPLNQIVKSMCQEYTDGILNLTKTTAFQTVTGMEAVQDAYLRELNKAMVKVSSGAFTLDSAVNSMVHDLAHKGIVSVEYGSGRKMNLESAARLCLRTSLAQMDGRIVMQQAKDRKIDLVEVTAHWGAREGEGVANHKEWQGKVYSISGKKHILEQLRIHQKIQKLETATGYPSNPLGLMGYNCRHRMHLFYAGVSKPTEWQPEPPSKTINGKVYNYTGMSNKMRYMERTVRSLKREKEALSRLGKDTTHINAKIKQKTREYKEFCTECGIKEKLNRLRYEAGTADVTKTKAWKDYKKAAEVKTANTDNQTKPIELEKIDATNEKVLLSVLEKYEEQIADSPIENAIVIEPDGTVTQCFGNLNGVNPERDLGKGRLNGAIVTHNHPVGSNNEYSFSPMDIQLFMDGKLKILRGIDEEYIYELTRNASVLDEHMTLEELFESMGKSARHESVITEAEKRGIGYTRRKRNDTERSVE